MAIPNSVSEVTFMFPGTLSEFEDPTFDDTQLDEELQKIGDSFGMSVGLDDQLTYWDWNDEECYFYVNFHPGAHQEPVTDLFAVEARIREALVKSGVLL